MNEITLVVVFYTLYVDFFNIIAFVKPIDTLKLMIIDLKAYPFSSKNSFISYNLRWRFINVYQQERHDD